jgi:hypothetical protein
VARVAAAAVPAAVALGALAVPVVRWSAARFNGGGRSGRR